MINMRAKITINRLHNNKFMNNSYELNNVCHSTLKNYFNFTQMKCAQLNHINTSNA